MYIHSASVGVETAVATAPLLPQEVPGGPALQQQDIILTVSPLTIRFTNLDVVLDEASTAQDAITDLGSPDTVMYAPTPANPYDRLDPSSAAAVSPGRDYYLNYMGLGVDLQFNGSTHMLSKCVLHTNAPGHQDFFSYNKAVFVLKLPQRDADAGPVAEAVSTNVQDVGTNNGVMNSTSSSSKKKRKKKKQQQQQQQENADNHCVSVTSESTWDELSASLGSMSSHPPVVRDSSKDTHPFPATHLHVLRPQCVVEVMHNGHIASLTVWRAA